MADFSRQYPPALGLLFGATSLLLALLAVVFVGKGIAALQEAGTLPVNPVNIPNLPAPGLYPSLQGARAADTGGLGDCQCLRLCPTQGTRLSLRDLR